MSEWHAAQKYYIVRLQNMRSNIMHMIGLFSKTHIYHVYVPVGNKHVYTVQLSWSLFLRQKF